MGRKSRIAFSIYTHLAFFARSQIINHFEAPYNKTLIVSSISHRAIS